MKFLKKTFCKINKNYTCSSLEDLLELLFVNACNLTMIQVGANDGVLCDPLRKHILNKKLQGIMLEPQRIVFERLKENHKNSEGLIFENVALGEAEGTTSLYKVDESLITQYGDLSGVASFDRNHVLNEIKSNKRRLIFTQNKVAQDYINEETVNVVSYGYLIEKHELKEVDILMIDAEGYDYEAVSMFPYDKLLPKAVIFEYKHLSKSLLIKLKAMLELRGYLPFFTKNDALFIHVKK